MKKRWNWLLEVITKNNLQYGAEIGIGYGQTSYHLLRSSTVLNLLCVDKYIIETDPEKGAMGKNWDPQRAEQSFLKAIAGYENKVNFFKQDSVQVSKFVPDESLDFVFIDADHRFYPAYNDINVWKDKVKEGGLISGHDLNKPGVYGALKSLQLNYFTTVDNVWYLWKS